ncbi:MAG: hypothetical protein GX877_07095 [Bacteroidales bacterium]|nr:hypothetical protein [Bacteroidales bacterium]
MKKFFKWSAAFLVLGVLAVGCIKNEPSNGIEAMRNAKASLLSAQAELEKAKAQVEIAQAAVLQAQAGLIDANAAILAAQKAAIEAETAWQKALTEFHKEGWEIRIKEMEEDLRARQAETDALVAAFELQIAQMQVELINAQRAYEASLLAFERWKLANIDALAQDLIDALDALTLQIQGIIYELAEAQIDLNYAKAEYLWYIQVEYPEDISHIRQQLEANKRRLTCEVDYLEGVVAAYDALYNNYHGELDGMIAEFQDMITMFRAGIAEMEIRYIELQEEYFWFNDGPLKAALAALTKSRKVGIKGVFSDGGSDPNIHVGNGNYEITAPWVGTPSMFLIMKRDMRVIEDTRAEFNDQNSGLIERNLNAKKTAANNAVKAYEDNWKKWQEYYDGARIETGHTGALYTAWVNAWNAWDADMKDYNAHLNTYDKMYTEAEKLIRLFMKYMNGFLNEGNLTVPGSATISEILGGIDFNAGTLAQYVFGVNAQAFIDVVNTIIGLINLPTEIDAIVTQLKGLMDGTHHDGYPPFWEHATAWTYKPTPVVYGDIMRSVYSRQDRELTQITTNDWYSWLFLYWLFENRTVELGLDGPNGGPVITINPAPYTDAAEQVLYDFFGKLNKAKYDAYMVGTSTAAIEKAVKAYYDAVEGLGDLETKMFRPFNREWFAYKGAAKFERSDVVYTVKPALTGIKPTPSTYTPIAYNDSLLLNEEQPDPINVNNFFFVLEAYKDQTGPIPSLDFDITYLDKYCNLWVEYAALLAAGEDCGKQWSQWVGDMRLWKWADRATYSSGHYFYAIYLDRDYRAYQDTWDRVDNGEYAALYDKIQELYDTEWAKYEDAQDLADELQDQADELDDELDYIEAMIPTYELLIVYYEGWIAQAQWAHNGGNVANDGLLSAWNKAKHRLIARQNELNRVLTALEILDQEFLNEAPLFLAEIEAILDRIETLQKQMEALEKLRDKLLAEYL